jgi:hypothetical protein
MNTLHKRRVIKAKRSAKIKRQEQQDKRVKETFDKLQKYPVRWHYTDIETGREVEHEVVLSHTVNNNILQIGSEYWIEDEGKMIKVADSDGLLNNGINEQDYQRKFMEDVKKGTVKGYVKHC